MSRSWGGVIEEEEVGTAEGERARVAAGFVSLRAARTTGKTAVADHDTQIDRIYRRAIVVFDEIC